MNSNNLNTTPLSVTLEVVDEFVVQEIQNDGTEIYKQPLTMSENFSRIIQKIDFDKLSSLLADKEESFNQESCDFEIPEIQTNVTSFVNPSQRSSFSQLPPQIESIKSKIVNALTNIAAMNDVIKVAKEPEYLVIERVAKDPTKLDEKPITVLVSKKKAITQAAQLINTASERFQNEANLNSRRIDFHNELLTMRQNWRLRKRGQNIIGDLSYRGAWSNFTQPGAFEVIRNESVNENSSSLKVILPKTLEGGNFFIIRTVKGNLQANTLFEPLKISHPLLSKNTSDSFWKTKLEIAQNMLFNNELFKRLAHESVQLKLPIPTIAAGNQIFAPLFPGLQLSISLCHFPNSGTLSNCSTPYDSTNNDLVLEHTLYQLLHEIHYRNMHFPLPHPTSATLALNSVRFFAGPRALDKKCLAQLSQSETILEQVIQQAQHSMLRLRTMCLIDSLAIEIQDPLIIPNWNYLNFSTETSVRVDMYSYGYEGLTGCRTSVMLHIGTRTVKAIMRDGRVMNLSFESQELRHLLLNLVSHHQVVAVQSLAKAMGWKVVSLNTSVGVGKQEPICGTASSIVLISPNGDKTIAVKSGPHSGLKVKYSSAPQEFLMSSLVSNPQWQQLNGPFKVVDWPRVPGKTFVNKMEFMMACLSIK